MSSHFTFTLQPQAGSHDEVYPDRHLFRMKLHCGLDETEFINPTLGTFFTPARQIKGLHKFTDVFILILDTKKMSFLATLFFSKINESLTFLFSTEWYTASAAIQGSKIMFSKEKRNELPREGSCTKSQESYSCYNKSLADPSEYGALWTQRIKRGKKEGGKCPEHMLSQGSLEQRETLLFTSLITFPECCIYWSRAHKLGLSQPYRSHINVTAALFNSRGLIPLLHTR